MNKLLKDWKKQSLFSVTLLVLFFLSYTSDSNAQNTISNKISVSFSNVSLKEAIQKIEKASKYTFFYDAKKTNLNQKVTINAVNQPFDSILVELFSQTDLNFEVENNQIVLIPKAAKNGSDQYSKKLTGVVSDGKGDPLPGVSIGIRGATRGVISAVDGSYSIDVRPGEVLFISYLGFKSQEISYTGQNKIDVTLLEDTQLLGEVVVTALGIKREQKALGYATQNVKGEDLATVKGVDVSTSLTGRVAGMNIRNSTEFNEAPTIRLRGENPLLVIDGVPSRNLTLRDVAPDDIESISVLKGATAAALYGEIGASGAVMVTTKKGFSEDGKVSVEVNSSSMFTAGYLTLPEVQTSYSSGIGGKYATGQYVWGDRMDEGRTADQYNPYTYQMDKDVPLVSKGKNNLKNFQQLSYILNNNVSVAQQGKLGGFRTSLTYVYNKGQYPNTELNKFTASVSGNIKYQNFDLDAGFTYNKRVYPNSVGAGYGQNGYIYNLLVWSGAEYDIRDYKNYWISGREDYEQNWMDKSWYNNPYYIANEIIHAEDYDILNGYVNANYQITKGLKASLRLGADSYSDRNEWRNPVGAFGGWNKKGYYYLKRAGSFKSSNDFMLSANYKIKDFGIDAVGGVSLYYTKTDDMWIETQNGLIVPGYYSIRASVDPPKADQSMNEWQTNSIYGRATLSWKSFLFVDVTGRNDWTSSLTKDERSYFYPSVAGSLVLSDLFKLPKEISLLKLRGSWTMTKSTPAVYEINTTYSVTPNVWDGYTAAYYPSLIRSAIILPASTRTFEFGLGSNFFVNRLHFDIAYYEKLYYDRMAKAGVSKASGFKENYININEDLVRKGIEITLGGTPVKTEDWRWDIDLNWARDRQYYASVDPEFSPDKPWVAKGKRYDWQNITDWDRDPSGNIIYGSNGLPVTSTYESVVGYTGPDWIWGLNNTIRWKSFTLDFSFDGRVGGVSYNNTESSMWNSGSHIDSDTQWRYDEVVNGKKTYIGPGVKVVSGKVERDSYGNITSDTREFAPNDVVVSYETFMKTTNADPTVNRGLNYYEQTFFKLRQLSLSYSLPANLVQKLGMQSASVSFIGQNLLLWTKEFRFSDPDKEENNLSSPSIRYIGGNVKINF